MDNHSKTVGCELCAQTGGELLWRNGFCRVVQIDEPGYPGFCRVVWNTHVKEMTDLKEEDRWRMMRVVFTVEAALRELLHPDKINLASLGNLTPHLHWHVIPRFAVDPHFPHPIWGPRQRDGNREAAKDIGKHLAAALASRLG